MSRAGNCRGLKKRLAALKYPQPSRNPRGLGLEGQSQESDLYTETNRSYERPPEQQWFSKAPNSVDLGLGEDVPTSWTDFTNEPTRRSVFKVG